MTRILVVDDQMLTRAGIAAILRTEPGFDVVGEAPDGEQGVAAAARLRPDVVLMDIRLPGMDGVEATRRILAGIDPRPRVLILTTFDRDEYVYAALRAGASGFLVKDTAPERILAAVAGVADGDLPMAATVTRRLIEAYTRPRSPSEAELSPAVEGLTGRETDVLRLVARGLSNAEIAAELTLTESTIKTHLNHAMSKLGLASRAQAVVFAYESGLVVARRDQ